MSWDHTFVQELRDEFPALQKTVGGQPLIYFDGPAGTQVPRRVAEAVTDSMLDKNANKGGVFLTSAQSDESLRQAHSAVADLVGAYDMDEVVFGQNMTSLTFALSRSLARNWRPGDEIVVTQLDHDANVTPWQLAADDAGIQVRYVPFRRDDYTLDLEKLRSQINSRTRLVAVTCASNATGSITPVKTVTQWAREAGALTFLDAVHYGPHSLMDVREWDCDFLACSAYKFFGPHVGVLWGRRELLESTFAYQVRPAPREIPGKWMTGTQSHEGISGTRACIDYLADIGRRLEPGAATRRDQLRAAYDGIGEYERLLSQHMLQGLSKLDGIRVYGITDPQRLHERVPTFSIVHEHIPSSQLAKELADQQIQVWNGHYYALQFTEQLGLEPEGMVRIGLVHYNTTAEIDRLLETLETIINHHRLAKT